MQKNCIVVGSDLHFCRRSPFTIAMLGGNRLNKRSGYKKDDKRTLKDGGHSTTWLTNPLIRDFFLLGASPRPAHQSKADYCNLRLEEENWRYTGRML